MRPYPLIDFPFSIALTMRLMTTRKTVSSIGSVKNGKLM